MRRLGVVLLGIALSGCAMPRPAVDLRAVGDVQEYQRDLAECAALSTHYFQSQMEITHAMIGGAAAGGFGAGAVGVATGASSADIGTNMGAGIVGGAIGSAIYATQQEESGRNRGVGLCLQGRGYDVLNAVELHLDPDTWCWEASRAGRDISDTWNGVVRGLTDKCVPAREKWLEDAKKTKNH